MAIMAAQPHARGRPWLRLNVIFYVENGTVFHQRYLNSENFYLLDFIAQNRELYGRCRSIGYMPLHKAYVQGKRTVQIYGYSKWSR